MDERKALLLVVVAAGALLLPVRVEQALDLLPLAADRLLDALHRGGRVHRGIATNGDRDDALETLERDRVHLDAAEEVEQDRLELHVRRVRVPQRRIWRGRRKVEEGDRAGRRLDALQGVVQDQRRSSRVRAARPARTLKLDMAMTSSIPTSSISITSPAKQRAQTSPCGRFLVCEPTRKSEASFLDAQNASELESSNGRIAFDFENEIAWGFLSWFCGRASGRERAARCGWRPRAGGETYEFAEGDLDLLTARRAPDDNRRLGSLLNQDGLPRVGGPLRARVLRLRGRCTRHGSASEQQGKQQNRVPMIGVA